MGYQRILDLKGVQTFEGGKSQEIRDYVKLKYKGMHHKKYDGCCTKQ